MRVNRRGAGVDHVHAQRPLGALCSLDLKILLWIPKKVTERLQLEKNISNLHFFIIFWLRGDYGRYEEAGFL